MKSNALKANTAPSSRFEQLSSGRGRIQAGGRLTFAACGNSPHSQSISRLFFCVALSADLLTNSESLLGVEGREPEGLKKNTDLRLKREEKLFKKCLGTRVLWFA